MNKRQGVLQSDAGFTTSVSLGVVVIIAALLIGVVVAWWESSGRYVSAWAWWGVFVILMIGISVLVVAGTKALREFIPRYRERRFLSRLQSEEKPLPEDGSEVEQRQLRDKMLEAIRTLQRSPDLRKQGGLPLYAVPWYLLIGASESGKTTLLRAVTSSFAPFERPSPSADGPTQNCDWWFFNTAIILDTSSSYAIPTKGEQDSTKWFRFLQLLRYYRELQPINGLIMAVGADTLASKPSEALRLEAAELRRRIDEAIRELGVDFPIYLLITRCDLIEGFTEFFGCLPEHVHRQVFGHVNETQPQVGSQPAQTTPTQRLESVYSEIVERLKQLRVSIFNAEKLPPALQRQKIFCFPEEFRALQQPLSVFAEALVGENPFQHRPFFRAIFFSSAQQQGTPHSLLRRQLHFDGPIKPLTTGAKTYFLHDLFAVMLRRDQYLARPTRRAVRGRLFRHLSIFGTGVALCGLLVLLLGWTFFTDQRVVASVNPQPCTVVEKPVGAPLLDQAESCRRVVQGLVDQNRQRFAWTKLVFNRSGRLEGELRQRYVEKFQSEVLAPLDAGIEQHLASGSETIALVFSLIKRIELTNQCLSVFGCPNLIAEDRQPDYSLMLTVQAQQPPSPVDVAALRDTYEAYLHWAAGLPGTLPHEQAVLADRLRSWFSAKQFAPRQILSWASQNYAAVTSQQYWENPSSTDGKTATHVDGAYTPTAWKRSILPFLQRTGDAVPDMEPLLRNFQEEYRVQYFEQWRRFLADFPLGEAPWWKTPEQRRRLAVKLMDESSPYNRIIDVAFEHLKPFLPTDLLPIDVAEGKPAQESGHFPWKFWQRQGISQFWSRLWGKKPPVEEETAATVVAPPPIPAWARVLGHYVKSESRKTYLDALKQMREPLASDASLEKSFQLAQAGFQEEKPTERSMHPVLKAWWVRGQFRDKEGAGQQAEQQDFWPLLDRPILFAWKVILERSAEFLQKSWTENFFAPTRGLSDLEQLDFFYGSQGKLREFVGQFAKPFLADNESRLGQVLEEEVPLGSGFLKALRDEKQLKPLLEMGKRNPYRVGVKATKESIITSHTNIVADNTEFRLVCDAKPYRLSTRAQDPTEASTDVAWSFEGCGDVVITILMTCDKRCVDTAAAVGMSVPAVSSLRVIKNYKGPSGFLQFIQDFLGKSRTFAIHAFASSSPPAEWPKLAETLGRYRISAIQVFYDVDVPPSLSKLMSLAPGAMPPASIKK